MAGKRKGFEDTRGTLFFEIARIAAEKKPKALLLENVKGLVNHDRGNTLDVMVQTLNDIGYLVDFDVLNSKYFGVPQNRERIFIVAIREDLKDHEEWVRETTKGHTVVPKGKRRLMKYVWLKSFNFDFPTQEKVTTRLRDILETNVDEKYYLDEEKTEKLVAQLTRETEDGYHAYRDDYKKSSAEPQMLGHIDIKGNDSIKRTYSTEGISPTLTTMGGGHREPKIAVDQEYGWADEFRIRREEQGLPIREATKKGYTIAEEGDSVNVQFPNSKTRRGRVGKQIANTLEASSINQGDVEKEKEIHPVLTPDRMEKHQNGRRFKENGEESFTLTSQDKHGVAIGNPPKYRIRKLTPRECFRLQNFPDEAFDKLKDAGISDSQLFKMSGNAVTTSVVEAIGERLIPIITDGGVSSEK